MDPATIAALAAPSLKQAWRGKGWGQWRTLHWRGDDGTVLFTQIELETHVLETTAAEWDAWVERVGAVRV